MDTSRESGATNVLPLSRPIHLYSINILYFNNPITFEATLEIKDPEMEDVEPYLVTTQFYIHFYFPL